MNQPKALVGDEFYQYQHMCAQNGWGSGGNIGKYVGGGETLEVDVDVVDACNYFCGFGM